MVYVRLIACMMLLAVLTVFALQPALADPEGQQNCWGTVVSQRASHYHDIGQHSSAQQEPRLGVGNLAHEVFDTSVGQLASLLGDIDDFTGDDPDHVTSCH